MSRLPHFAVFLSAAIHLLLFSICPVSSSRIYETNDAVVIEVVDYTRARNLADQPPTRSARSSNYGNPATIPLPYAFNPYYTGLYQQPNLLPWLYPLRKQASSNVESRQQNIACGAGPASPPTRQTVGNRIVGGSEAVRNSWPFIVGLRTDVDDKPGDVSCGGSLISPTKILTAAHCVNEKTVSEIESMTVSLGMHTQGKAEQTANDAQHTRRVTRVVYHKDYNSNTLYNDIAILTIDPPITYSKDISPVCLAPASTAVDQFVDKDAVIMGWGDLVSDGESPNALQQNTIKVISNADCNKRYANAITNQQVCATAPGKDTCQGDSGGPMVVQTKDGSTTWTQVGVVSYGRGCANPNYAGVYASVAFFRNWINTYMND